MKTVHTSKKGINYLYKILLSKPQTITRAAFWKIPHNSGLEDTCLKIGRYKRTDFLEDELEINNPKSELTLTNTELGNLVNFLKENYEAFKDGAQKYISVGDGFDEGSANTLTAIFKTKEKQKLFKLILDKNLIEEDLLRSVEIKNKNLAIAEFEDMLKNEPTETVWQSWFKNNVWVLGSDIVEVLDERPIDTKNISDFLTKSPDGHLDIIEIKRPQNGKMDFWSKTRDHDNLIPSGELTKSITQSINYIYEVEREWAKLLEKTKTKVIKPRCTLVFGRSEGWKDDEYKYFRMLNSSYHSLSIMTYDQVLERAKRILQKLTEKQQ